MNSKKNFPFIRNIRGILTHPNTPTKIFFLIILVVDAYLLALPFSQNVQTDVMKKFHLLTKPFIKWSLLQAVPSMYNFSNEIWISPEELDLNALDQLADPPAGLSHFWVNHYPLRVVTFGAYGREMMYRSKTPEYITIQTSYRRLEMTSEYRYGLAPGGMRLMPVAMHVKGIK